MSAVYHLVDPAVWAAAGAEYRPESLAAEGFVHLSFTDQVAGSADRHLADASALVALEVDPAAAGAELVVEDSYGSGTAFPHLYGPLPRAAVVRVIPLRRAGGRWQFNADGAAAPASPDR